MRGKRVLLAKLVHASAHLTSQRPDKCLGVYSKQNWYRYVFCRCHFVARRCACDPTLSDATPRAAGPWWRWKDRGDLRMAAFNAAAVSLLAPVFTGTCSVSYSYQGDRDDVGWQTLHGAPVCCSCLLHPSFLGGGNNTNASASTIAREEHERVQTRSRDTQGTLAPCRTGANNH